jgi:hypothetical protein
MILCQKKTPFGKEHHGKTKSARNLGQLHFSSLQHAYVSRDVERTTQFITARSLDRRILASTFGYFMSVSDVCISTDQIIVAVTLELVNLLASVLCLQFYAILK